MRTRFLFPLAALLACGGKIDETAVDASTDTSTNDVAKGDVITPADVITPVDVIIPPKPDASPVVCSGKTGEGYIGPNGECGERNEWKCNDGNVYEIACKCPPDPNGTTCACRKNGLTTKVFLGNVCPACKGVVAAASQCGFPQ